MKGFLKYHLLTIFLLASIAANGQHCKFYTAEFRDSLIATKTSKILVNNLAISNPNNKTMRVAYHLDIPKNWKLISSSEHKVLADTLIMLPYSDTLIPINLLMLPKAQAKWDSITITMTLPEIGDTHVYHYHFKPEPIWSYVCTNFSNEIEVTNNDNSDNLMKVYLRNTGNIEDTFCLKYNSPKLDIDDSTKVVLQPGKDTTIFRHVKIKSWKLKDLRNERIILIASNRHDDTRHLYCDIKKAHNTIIENKSAYTTAPINIELGAMNAGDMKTTSYYGAIKGKYEFANKSSLDFSYRSNQAGALMNQYQPNVFNIHYHNKSIDITAGQLSGPRDFFVFGNGLNVKYTAANSEWAVTAIRHINLPFQTNASSDNIAVTGRYDLAKMQHNTLLTVNDDIRYMLRSYLANDRIRILNKQGLSLSVNMGIGMTEKTRAVTGMDKFTMGHSLGYILNIVKKHWSLSSYLTYNSSEYPGVFRGSQLQNHDLLWLMKKSSIGAFYSSNGMRANNYRDTLYNSDFLSYNLTKYGLSYNIGSIGQKMTINFKVGKAFQDGSIGMFGGLKDMYSADIFASYRIRSSNLVFSTNNVYGNDLLFTNTNLLYNNKFCGVNVSYNRTPTPNSDGVLVPMETVNGGPSVNFLFCRKTIMTNFRYNISKLLGEDSYTSGVGANIAYQNRKAGLRVMANTFYSFTKTSANTPFQNSRYGTFSIAKDLNIPIPKTKKYYNLKIVLFRDLNGNDQKEDNEPALENAMLYVEKFNLVTNKNGEVDCKNLPKGNYKISFINSKTAKLIATNGPVQTITLDDDTKVFIPFREGKVLKGKVHIDHDTLSLTKITPEYMKIVITDSMDHIYSAVSNANGDFSITLPDGVYKASLLTEVLDESGFKTEQPIREVDLLSNDSEFIDFNIKQKKRKIRVLDNIK